MDCILRNFTEMNHLWLRMQTTKANKREKREIERKELKVLVGSNLACLSQLEGFDAEFFKSVCSCYQTAINHEQFELNVNVD